MPSLFEAICDGERRGWTREVAVQRLFDAMRSPFARGRVLGVCTITHSSKGDSSNCWKIARADSAKSPIPVDIWNCFKGIENDLSAKWQDDEEKPSEWAQTDWASSTVERVYCNFLAWLCDEAGWWTTGSADPYFVQVRFTGLEVPQSIIDFCMTYSEAELIKMIDDWPGNNGTVFLKTYWGDERLRIDRDGLRDLWRKRRNEAGKRGPRPRLRGQIPR